MPARLDARTALARLAQRQDGLFHVQQARAAGVSDRMLTLMFRRGEIVRVHIGVYRYTCVPWTWEARQRAAVLGGGPHAYASHAGAARLLGLRGVPCGRPEICRPGNAESELDGVWVHRSRELEDVDVTDVRGIRCTAGPRTVIDLACRLPRTGRIALVDEAICAGAASRSLLYRRACALVNGRAGVGTLIDITRPEAEGIFWSALERGFGRGVRRHQLPTPEFNAPVRIDGRLFYADALWRPQMVVGELHGLAFHSRPDQRGRDDERLNLFASMGLRTVVFTWQDVMGDFDPAAQTLRRTLAVSAG